MRILSEYLKQKDQKFYCKDNKNEKELIVPLVNLSGGSATDIQLMELKKLAKNEADYLIDLYQTCNGAKLQVHQKTIGLLISPIGELVELNEKWKESFSYYDEEDLYDFQKEGFAFAQIFQSGNYFVVHKGKVFYSDHDGGDDTKWGSSVAEFFRIALTDPAKFLLDAGCYTRYYDGKTETQYIPEKLLKE